MAIAAGLVVVMALVLSTVVGDPDRGSSGEGGDPPFARISVEPPRGRATSPSTTPVLHVRQGAPSPADGSVGRPYATIGAAVDSAVPRTTVLVESGVYRETLTTQVPDLTVRAAPGATVWLDGTVALHDAEHRSGLWRFTGQAPRLDSSPTYERGAPDGTEPGWRWVPPERPLAPDPSQVWLDDARLRQVPGVSDVTSGTFAIDGDDVVIGDDPTSRTVAVGTRPHALLAVAPRLRFEDIGIRRYVPSVPDFGAVVIGGRGDHLSRVVVADSSTTGISVQSTQVTLESVQVTGSGLLGVGAHQAFGLTVIGGRIAHNNSAGFNPAPNAGGIKITRSSDVLISGTRIDGNVGNGLWLDESVARATVVSTTASGNTLHGVVAELSSDVVVVDCTLTDNGGNGLRAQNSDKVRVWHVTALRNHRAVDMVQDDRRPGSPDAPAVVHDGRIPAMPWLMGSSDIANSILGESTGDAEVGVEDFTTALAADDIGLRLHDNAYVHPEPPSRDGAQWTHVWTRPHDDPDVYTSLAGFRAAHPQDQGSVQVDRLADVPRSAPPPLPPELVSRSGLSPLPLRGATP